jgi:nucleoside-diphosphate-sugar epimerase|tara:strand:+ start:102 stop:1217 length:1116 start_codon:yes stop_codon:yes gene_type:complete
MKKRNASPKKKKQNILVTGGLGFIGSHVVVKLINEGHKVVILDTKTDYGYLDADELDYVFKERFFGIANRMTDSVSLNIYTINVANPELKTLFEAEKFDSVIHLASFPRQKVVNQNPQSGSQVMSEGLLNLLELSKQTNVKRFCYISSSMVYGDFNDNVEEWEDCDPQGQYAIMKYAGELLVQDYTRQYGLDHTIIRPSAVYGPLDVCDRVISKFFINAIKGEKLTVNGKMEKLDFTFVNDVADGIVQATESSVAKNETYNLTRSKGVTLYDAANMVKQIVGKGNIEVKQKDKDFPSRGSLSIEKAQKDFGYNPTTDLNEGLVIYYNWLLNSTYWQEQFNPKPKPQDVIKVTPIKVTPPAKKKSKAKPKAK